MSSFDVAGMPLTVAASVSRTGAKSAAPLSPPCENRARSRLKHPSSGPQGNTVWIVGIEKSRWRMPVAALQ